MQVKYFKDSKPVYEIAEADEEGYYEIDGKKIKEADQGYSIFLGENMFVRKESEEDGLEEIKLVDFDGNTLLEDSAYGYKLQNGKFYYINKDKEIKSVELNL